jgi:hypothetical protein
MPIVVDIQRADNGATSRLLMPVFKYSDTELVRMRGRYPLCHLNLGMAKIVMTNKSPTNLTTITMLRPFVRMQRGVLPGRQNVQLRVSGR